MEFGKLLALIGLMNQMLILSCWIFIQGREACSGDFSPPPTPHPLKFSIGLYSDI